MQDLAPPIIEKQYIGVNDNLPAQDLPPGYFVRANNVFVSDNKITKVQGSSTIASSIALKPFNGLGTFENLSSGNKYLIANLDGASVSQAYSWNGSGNFSAISGLTSTNGLQMQFETAANYVFGFDGANVFDWDGTSATKNRSGIPVGKFSSWFHNYLFVAGHTTNVNRVYWSNLGTPTTFDANNYVDVNPGDGDKIVALGRIQDELIVLKRNTIWSITGFSGSSFSATTIATQNTNARIIGYGCVAPLSVISTGNDVYFLSFMGQVPVIRSLRKTQYATTLAGGVISHDIDVTMAGINKTYITGIVGAYDGRYCYWSIPTNSSTTNNKIIVLDTFGIAKKGGRTVYPWTTMTGKNASLFTLSTISGNANIYFAESGSTGNVLKFDSSVHSDNGVVIELDVITRSFMPDPARKEKWKYLYTRFDTGVSSVLTIDAKVDDWSEYVNQDTVSLAGTSPGLGSFILDTSVLDGATTNRHRTNLAQLIGKTLSLEITERSTSAVTIYDHELYYQPKGLRAK